MNNKKRMWNWILTTCIIYVVGIFMLTALTGCGTSEFGRVKGENTTEDCYIQGKQLLCPGGLIFDLTDIGKDTDTDTSCTIQNDSVVCPDGTTLPVSTGITLTATDLPTTNGCYPISNGLFVEVIKGAEFYDVYKHSSCSDYVNGELREICDNNEPAFGSSNFGFGNGGTATMCPYNNLIIYGRVLNSVLTISVLEVL